MTLSAITDVDLIMSYWMGEAIAHTIVSFGFADGQRLAFSIETRKERQEQYSSVAGFFKQYELAIIAADERDVVRTRSNIRGEDVRLYRMRRRARRCIRLLFLEYLDTANDLAAHPRFYNTLTANCTSLVFDMVRVIHPGLPLDIRVILAGYLPDYAYDVGATVSNIPASNASVSSHEFTTKRSWPTQPPTSRQESAMEFPSRTRLRIRLTHQ